MGDRYRTIYIGLSLALLAVVAFGIAFATPEGDGSGRPEVLERISPSPGSQINRQGRLEVDLPVGYAAELWIDFRGSGDTGPNWFRIPTEEVVVVTETGVHSWQPGPNSTIGFWQPGNQRVRAVWDTTTGLPDPGEYAWEFRVRG